MTTMRSSRSQVDILAVLLVTISATAVATPPTDGEPTRVTGSGTSPTTAATTTTISTTTNTTFPATTTTEDPHGGVPMGIKNHTCDDAKVSISVDWDKSKTDVYTCLESDPPRISNAEDDRYFTTGVCDAIADRPKHVCFPEAITYNVSIPTSGHHRPLWPVYGEYIYAPPQRWLHSLEHGGIVFLYHPCADKGLIHAFKTIAKGCIRRHVISPSKALPEGKHFAILAWRCKLLLSYPSLQPIVRFVQEHAKHSPELNVYSDGQYDYGLLDKADIVSDMLDSKLCPHLAELTFKVSSVRRTPLGHRRRPRPHSRRHGHRKRPLSAIRLSGKERRQTFWPQR